MGPFSGFDKSGRNRRLLESALLCFPSGLPSRSERWRLPVGLDEGKIVDFLSTLIVRTPPECLTNRWYSCDIASWFYLLLWKLTALDHFIPLDAKLSWWPGMEDEVDENTTDEEKEQKAHTRTQSTISFVRSLDCGHSLVVGAVTSIPRWSFARALESKHYVEEKPCGLTKACRDIDELTLNIVGGNDPLVEDLIAAEELPDILRMKCCRSLIISFLYVAEHERAYSSTPWKLLKKETSWTTAFDELRSPPGCCDETGLRKKLFAYLSTVGRARTLNTETSLEQMFVVGSEIVLEPGGFTTKDAEASFSLGRMTGLNCPYRSMQLTTCYREVCLRFLCRQQRSFMDNASEKFFGWKESMDELVSMKKSIKNSFGVFMKRMGKMPEQICDVWSDIRLSAKREMREEAVSDKSRIPLPLCL